jgi:hypothetical protein
VRRDLIGKTQSLELFGHLDDQEEVLDALQPAGAIEQVEVDLAGLRRHDVGPGRDEEDAAVGAQVVRVEELVELVERRRVARCLPVVPLRTSSSLDVPDRISPVSERVS